MKILFQIYIYTLLICLLPALSVAQQYQRVDGTDYFLVLFPDASVALGKIVGTDIQLVSEEDVLDALQKSVVTDKEIIQGLNKVIIGKPVQVPKSKFFKPLKKIVKGARDGLSGKELAKVLATRKRLSDRRKINQRAIDQIKVFFQDKVLPPIDTFRDTFTYTYTDQGVQKWIFGVYVGFTLPKKYEKATSAIVCASFSGNTSDPHRGAQVPLESEETITNDPCARATLFGDVSCPGAYGKGILGSVLSSSSGVGSEPSTTAVQAVLASSGSNIHQFRYKTKKVKCILK